MLCNVSQLTGIIITNDAECVVNFMTLIFSDAQNVVYVTTQMKKYRKIATSD